MQFVELFKLISRGKKTGRKATDSMQMKSFWSSLWWRCDYSQTVNNLDLEKSEGFKTVWPVSKWGFSTLSINCHALQWLQICLECEWTHKWGKDPPALWLRRAVGKFQRLSSGFVLTSSAFNCILSSKFFEDITVLSICRYLKEEAGLCHVFFPGQTASFCLTFTVWNYSLLFLVKARPVA